MACLEVDRLAPKNGAVLNMPVSSVNPVLYSVTISTPLVLGSYLPESTVTATFTVVGSTVYLDVDMVTFTGHDNLIPYFVAPVGTPTILVPRQTQYVPCVVRAPVQPQSGVAMITPNGVIAVASDPTGTQGWTGAGIIYQAMGYYTLL